MAKKQTKAKNQETKAKQTKKTITKKEQPKRKTKEVQKKSASSVPAAYKAYNEEQYKIYKEKYKEWSEKTNDQIKELLKVNNQTRTGNKNDLLMKVADGFALGQIPRCPSCFGGRPKFNQKNGTYHCAGDRDDTDFKNCHKDYTMDTLPRLEWVNE